MKLPYDPVKDGAADRRELSQRAGGARGLKIKTFAEFIAFAKQEPGKLDSPPPAWVRLRTWRASCSTTWPRSTSCTSLRAARRRAGPAGRRVAAYYSTLSTAQPHIEAGQADPAGQHGLRRIPSLPRCPPSPSRATRATTPPTGTPSSPRRRCPGPAGSVERRTGEGVAGARGGGRTRQARACRPARHARRTGAEIRETAQWGG